MTVEVKVAVAWEIPPSVEAKVLVPEGVLELVLELELEPELEIKPVLVPVVLVPEPVLGSRACGTGLPFWER